jgi:hypothetical protein
MTGGAPNERGGPAPRFGWIGEAALMFGAILAADFALGPAVGLLDASPHAFWIPVLVVALGHGTTGGIATAILATCLGWWHGWPPVSGDIDFYGRVLHQWKEPVLWLAAAFVCGRLHERHTLEKDTLERRALEAETQRRTIADHAIGLRAHVARLEAAIAAAPRRGGEEQLALVALVDDLDTPHLEARLRGIARDFLGSDILGFWLAGSHGWQRVWGAPELERMLPSIEPRMDDGAEAITVPHMLADASLRAGVRLVVPVRDPVNGWLGGLMLLGEPDRRLRGRAALALAGAFGRLLGEAIFGDGRNASPAANRSLLAMVADDGPR